MTDAINDDDRRLFAELGYVVLKNQFSAAEIRPIQKECDRLEAQANRLRPKVPEIQPRGTLEGGAVYDRLDPVIADSQLFRELVSDERMLAPLRSLLEEDVCLLKDKLILKPAGAAGYGLHQDYPYWDYLGVPAEVILSVVLAIDPCRAENGALQVIPGWHQRRLPSAAADPRDIDEASVDLSRLVLLPLEAGDLLLFHSLTPHCSGPNRSHGSRRAFFLTYNAARYHSVYEKYQSLRHAGGRNTGPQGD